MRYLFVPGADLTRESIVIDGPDAHHLLNVLRIRAGETLTLLDNAGAACLAEVSALDKRSITVRITKRVPCPPDPPVHVTVAQALGKGDKFDQVIQHATEVGASAFIPLLTERTVVKIDPRDSESKRARWSQIAKSAAEQSGRARIPAVAPAATLRDLVARFPSFDRVLLLHPPGEKGVPAAGHASRITHHASPDVSPCLLVSLSPCLVLVGPEGGFSEAEVAMAEAAGTVRTSLGPYTLRTETAALVAVSRILHEAEQA